MKKTLIFVTILINICVSLSAQTLTLVSRATTTAPGATIITPAQTHTTGNLLVVGSETNLGATVTVIVNTCGDAWSATPKTPVNIGGSNIGSIFFTSTSANSGIPTGTVGCSNDIITLTPSGGNYNTAVVDEINKTSGTWGFVDDKTDSGSGTTITGTTITITNPSFIFGELTLAPDTLTGTNGFTATSQDAGGGYVWNLSNPSVSTNQAATGTQVGSGVWGMISAAFAATGGSPPTTTLPSITLLGAGR